MDHFATSVESAFAGLMQDLDSDIESLSLSKCSSGEALVRHVTALESALENLQNKTAALCLQIQAGVANIRKRQNALSCQVYRLPVEILTEVMLLVIETSDPLENGRDKSRSSILGVSWHWFNIVTSTPFLSSYLFNRHGIRKTRHLIELSKAASLDITCTDGSCQIEEVDTWMHHVLVHIQRWRSLRLQVLRSRRDLHIPTTPAPLLETLHVTSHLFHEVTNLFNGEAPRLRDLQIQPIYITWDKLTFTRLEILRITDIDGEDEVWRTRYSNLFKSLPLLEYVHIQLKKGLSTDATDSVAEVSSGTKFDLIVLPRLKSMELEDLPPRITATILTSTVSTQNSHPPCLRAVFSHARPWLLEMISLPDPDSLMPCIIQKLTGLDLWFRSSERNFRLRGQFTAAETPRWKLQIPLMLRFDGFSWPMSPVMNSFIIQWAQPTLSSLAIAGRLEFSEAGLNLGGILPLLTGLELLELSYNDDEDAVHAVFSALQTLHESGTSSVWLCPNLKKLDFRSISFRPKRLYELVNVRYGPPSTTLGIYRAPIEQLDIRYCGPVGEEAELKKEMAEIEAIVKSQEGGFLFELRDKSLYSDLF